MAANTKVTRIKAKDASAKPVKSTKAAKTPTKKAPKKPEVTSSNAFVRGLKSFGGYFVGAWEELKQVRWPTRKATWGLTLAVILFSLFFVVLIVLLDLLFKYLFELIIT